MPTTNLLSSDLPISGETILIIGNRSYKNMGDELILLGTVKLLLGLLPWESCNTEGEGKRGVKLIISCYDPKRLKGFFSQFIDTKQITFIHEIPKGPRSFFSWLKKGWLKELKYFRTTDSMILGGGEILTEESSSAYWYWLISMRPFLLHVINPKKQKSLYIMWGIQIPKSRLNKFLLRFLLNHTTHLYLRDFQAVEEVKKFWYANTEFFMDTSYFAYEWETVSSLKKDPYIIVNICDQRFVEQIAEEITPYLQQGYHLLYVPIFQSRGQGQSDITFKHSLEQLLSLDTPLEVLDWKEDFSHFVEVLAGAEKVICTRLHLFLVASYLKRPTEVFPYQKKILKMQKVIQKIFPLSA